MRDRSICGIREVFHPPEISVLELPATIVACPSSGSHIPFVPPSPPRNDEDDPPVIVQCPQCGRLTPSDAGEVLYCTHCRGIFISDSEGNILAPFAAESNCPQCGNALWLDPDHFTTEFPGVNVLIDTDVRGVCRSCGAMPRIVDLERQEWSWFAVSD